MEKLKKRKIITICASASHYKKVIEIEGKLKKLGFKVIIPKTANIMKKNSDFDVTHYKTWYQDAKDYHKKTKLMVNHFNKVLLADAILITNFEKNGLEGYIGGNALMEMTVAFTNNIKIFVLNPIDESLGIKEEVYGLKPIFLDGNLSLLAKALK